ncbi:MAG: hypothetical protein IT392_12935 [Nitrospirae bacterium]|nr:hypothetical protein [Nitrospirota bacterium]
MDALKHHHIRFKQAPVWGGAPEWEAKISEIQGVTRVRIDAEKGDCLVEYNLLKCREEEIERRLIEAGFVLDESLKEKVKRGWVHFTEENEQAELKHGRTAPCCGNVEEIERRRKMGK